LLSEHCAQKKFSKISPIGIFYGELSSKLAFKNFCSVGLTFADSALRSKYFSKVSPVFALYGELSSKFREFLPELVF